MNWLWNYLGTRAGSIIAPLALAPIAYVLTWLSLHIPFLHSVNTPENQMAIAGFIWGIGNAWINSGTNANARKYSEPVQRFMNVLAAKMGLKVIEEDGIVGAVTAKKADEIKSKMTVPGGPFNPNADVRPAQPVD